MALSFNARDDLLEGPPAAATAGGLGRRVDARRLVRNGAVVADVAHFKVANTGYNAALAVGRCVVRSRDEIDVGEDLASA